VTKPIVLTLLTKPGCHLCEEAKTVVDSVLAQFKHQNSDDVQLELTELNILEDETLMAKYAEEIPVLQINGLTHAYWRIDPARLKASLETLWEGS
jgi:glutaredoxin